MTKWIVWVTMFVVYNFFVISLHEGLNYSFKLPYVHSEQHHLDNLFLKRAKSNLDIFLKNFFENEGSGIGIGKKKLSIALHNILETVVKEFTTSMCNDSNNANISVGSGANKNDSVLMSIPTRGPVQSYISTRNSKPLKGHIPSLLNSTTATLLPDTSLGTSNVTVLSYSQTSKPSLKNTVETELCPVFSNTLQGTEKYARYAVSIPIQLEGALPLDMGMANVLAIYHAIRLFSRDTIDVVV